jgi:hypothetical protein
MGEDSITWTPKGRKAKVTIGNAPDIEVSKKTTTVDVGYNSYRRKHTTTLKLKNYKSNEVTLMLTDYYPNNLEDGSFQTSHEFVQKPGNLMELNVTLAAGASEEIVYSYTT